MPRAAKVLVAVVLAVVLVRWLTGARREPEPVATGSAHWPPLVPVASGGPTADDGEEPGERPWMPPLPDGSCPPGYPVKAKRSSGIYHVVGGLAYERTFPDRCYPDGAAAEGDGFRAAKR